MKVPLESDEQKALVQWLKLEKIPFVVAMNENIFSFLNRDIAVKIQAKSKAMGVQRGVSDLIIMLPNRILFLELKRQKGGKLSDEQKKFLGTMSEFPYAVSGVANGWMEAKAMIEYWRDIK